MSTYGTILDSFKDLTGDSGNFFLSALQIDRFANRALIETCERARYKDVAKLINVVNGTEVYSIDAEGYDIFRVEYEDVNGTSILYPITRDSLRHSKRDWSYRTGRPRFYYLDELYSSQDYLSVGLWEIPSTSVTDGLRVWYHAFPTTADGTDAPGLAAELDIPDWASGAVLYYMLHLAYTADTKIQDPGAAALYMMMYEDVLDRLIIRSRDRDGKRWTMGSPSGPDRNVLNRLPQRVPTV